MGAEHSYMWLSAGPDMLQGEEQHDAMRLWQVLSVLIAIGKCEVYPKLVLLPQRHAQKCMRQQV